MKFTHREHCRMCSSVMIYVQRRGSSEGLWVCPVCSTRRRIIRVEQDEDEERNHAERPVNKGIRISDARPSVEG